MGPQFHASQEPRRVFRFLIFRVLQTPMGITGEITDSRKSPDPSGQEL